MGVDGRWDRLFVVLVPGVQGETTADGLRAGVPGSSVVRPPTTGLAFFTCGGDETPRPDAWWAESGIADTRPVIVAAHEDDLAAWLPGLDADLVVAVPSEEARAEYTGMPSVLSVVTADPRELAQVALQAHATGAARAKWADPQPEPDAQPQPEPEPDPEPAGTGWRRADPGRSKQKGEDPFAILSQVPSVYGGEGPPAAIEPIVVEGEPGEPKGSEPKPEPEPDPEPPAPVEPEPVGPPAWYRDVGDREPDGAGWSATLSLAELVGLLSEDGDGRSGYPGDGVRLEHPPLCVAVVSPEGGITRSGSATAQAVVLGEAVRPLHASVGLVDTRPGNPDVWASLGADRGSCSMRELIMRLTRGEAIRPPARSDRLPLAFYPEADGPFEGYAPTQIQRAAAHLRGQHVATIVDLPNRRPGFTSAEAAVAALWIGQSDVVVLPATANSASLRGVLDYLGTESVRDKPVVIAYLVPRGRQPRRTSPIRGLLEEVRRSVAAMVDLPDDDSGTEALVLRGTAGPDGHLLRHSHLRLAQTVVRAAVRQPQGVWS